MSQREILSWAAAELGHTTLTSAFPLLSPLVQLLLCVIYSFTQPSKPVPEIREEESSLNSECLPSSSSAFAAAALSLVGAVVTRSHGTEGWM